MPADFSQPVPISTGIAPAAPYVQRPPSPPYIHIPTIFSDGHNSMSIVPAFDNVETSSLTTDDLEVITQGRTQIAHDSAQTWKYESRRQAQAVLDFIYLGPSSVARDRAFLQREGITMLLAARDASMANIRLMSVERTAKELGLESAYIDVSGHQELIRAFPIAVSKINEHLLSVYRSQAIQSHHAKNRCAEGEMIIDSNNFRRGKVLVFCETGNDRSAAIVAAYIMTVFGMDMVKTLQFIGLQRFCTNFDEETKHWLKSYEDILEARRMVARGLEQAEARGPSPAPSRMPSKRGIDDTMDVDDDNQDNSAFALDMDRYMDRPAFVPFVEKSDVVR